MVSYLKLPSTCNFHKNSDYPVKYEAMANKSQSSGGQLGTSNQYVTSLEFLDETIAIHLEGQQLRRYVDKSHAVLTSRLEHKFDFLEQKLINCENQSVPSQHVYESLEQKFIDLQCKYVNLERKYTDIQTLNDEYSLIKSQLVSVQNKTSQISNDVNNLKQHGNIKPLQEIQTLQQAIQTVSAETHSLYVNERARSRDFLALYNMTIDSKRLLSELNTNTSNQLKNLSTKTNKQIINLEHSQNMTAADIISKFQQ
ncbi:MYO18 [Mytilus coruscus]|uniref:MYO18 n=1 Tax=Mytilus coruscus TaxID=42192 RepID=A0A6J8A4Q8_MYTCO|nr:MYO18 [Mytilus coruscus]